MFLWLYQLFLLLIDGVHFVWNTIVVVLQAAFHVIVPPTKKSLDGDIVLITGGGHGLGRELAKLIARLGAIVVIVDINVKLNKQTAEEIKQFGGSAYAYECDVSDRNDVIKVAKQIRSDVGHVTLLINNAGILHCHPLLMLNHQQIQRTLEVNTLSHFWTIQEFLPAMIEQKKGHIVCISSLAGKSGFPNLVAYSASKFGVAGMMEALAEEMRHYGHEFIVCTTVHPTVIATGMAKKPRIKHPWLCPILDTVNTAEVVLDGILRNYKTVFIPRSLVFFDIIRALPNKVQEKFIDFLGAGLDPHDD